MRIRPDDRRSEYSWVRLKNGSKRRVFSIHRLVALAFLPNPLSLPTVNHKNGIKRDNVVTNLEWSSVADNNRHALRTGLRRPIVAPKGEEARHHKLTEAKVREARRLHARGAMNGKELAKKYGVAPCTMYNVLNRIDWKHVL
jgi:hypothetical protein